MWQRVKGCSQNESSGQFVNAYKLEVNPAKGWQKFKLKSSSPCKKTFFLPSAALRVIYVTLEVSELLDDRELPNF